MDKQLFGVLLKNAGFVNEGKDPAYRKGDIVMIVGNDHAGAMLKNHESLANLEPFRTVEFTPNTGEAIIDRFISAVEYDAEMLKEAMKNDELTEARAHLTKIVRECDLSAAHNLVLFRATDGLIARIRWNNMEFPINLDGTVPVMISNVERTVPLKIALAMFMMS